MHQTYWNGQGSERWTRNKMIEACKITPGRVVYIVWLYCHRAHLGIHLTHDPVMKLLVDNTSASQNHKCTRFFLCSSNCKFYGVKRAQFITWLIKQGDVSWDPRRTADLLIFVHQCETDLASSSSYYGRSPVYKLCFCVYLIGCYL